MKHRRALPALLAFVALVQILMMPRMWMAGDPVVVRTAARALVRQGVLHVDDTLAGNLERADSNFVRNRETGLHYSKWGVLNTLAFAIPTAIAHIAIPGDEIVEKHIFNVFFVALSVAYAAVLFGLAGQFTRRAAVSVVFVLCCFYGTFLWYYTRAQCIDLLVALLYGLHLLPLIRWLRHQRPLDFLYSCAGLGLLILCRQAFTLYVPLLILLLWKRQGGRFWRRPALQVSVGLLCVACGTQLLFNHLKTGAWLSSGYSQSPEWALPWIDPGVLSKLYTTALDPQRGILWHFPVVVIALFGLHHFWRRHREPYAVVLAHLAIMSVLVASITHLWDGEWSYGPRLLLFVLPPLCLPAVVVIEKVWRARQWKNWRVALTLVLLLVSARAQVVVNTMPFHFFYHAHAHLSRMTDPRFNYRLQQYLARTHHAGIYSDLRELAAGETGGKVFALVKYYRPELHARLQEQMRQALNVNIWWWPESSRIVPGQRSGSAHTAARSD